MIPSGFTSIVLGSMGARSTSAASFGKGSAERPWKERDQSTREGSLSLISGRGEAVVGGVCWVVGLGVGGADIGVVGAMAAAAWA